MPDWYAIYGCDNEASLDNGISVHRIPFPDCKSVEGRARRKSWIAFIDTTRQDFVLSSNSAVCCEHFTPDS